MAKENNKPSVVYRLTQKLGDFQAAKAEWSKRLLKPSKAQAVRALAATADPTPTLNVVGVGIGEKLVDGKSTGIMAVKFLVQNKYPEEQLEAKHVLPKTINGLPVDVEQVGLFRRFVPTTRRRRPPVTPAMPNPRIKIRPAPPGCSIGFQDPNHQFVMAGTFGALVKNNQRVYVLSNNHVLADENRLPAGAPIFQQGLLDHGDPATGQIAELTKAVLLRSDTTNKVDCAIAEALKTSLVSKAILLIGPPQGTTNAKIDMVVHKFGRTTGYRAGRVTSIDTDVTVQYETGNFTFGGQIIIVGLNGQPFSDAGDSGSLILERSSGKAVGLLFAGSPSHTIANHIGDVLKALGVVLA